ncbi:MAG: hypothetical protein RR404_00340 [Bacilli bacterium]
MKNNLKIKKAYKLWEKMLIIASCIFIIICIVFYGIRLVKYYKIYNPKIDNKEVELIRNAILKNQTIVYENDGLYRVSGLYIYKGKNVNNYIRYSNMLWRIIKFNNDGSLDIVLDDNINMLKWNQEIKNFNESDIYKYLNNYFYKQLSLKQLSTTVICNDIIEDLNKITCNNIISNSYVRLLNVSEYLNSKTTESYIETGKNIWLGNRSKEFVWNINNANLSSSKPDNMYYIKPVVTIKNSTVLLSGKGTKIDPYIIDNRETLEVGTYVKLDNDIWVIYDKFNDQYKLSLTKFISKTEKYSLNSLNYDILKEDTLAQYLNNEYYNSLSYKNKLIEADWYSGNYNHYEDVFKNVVKAKVGILNVCDLKFSNLENYYLMTPSNKDKMYLYSSTIVDSKPNLLRQIIPTISINNLNIIEGDGTVSSPYILEV